MAEDVNETVRIVGRSSSGMRVGDRARDALNGQVLMAAIATPVAMQNREFKYSIPVSSSEYQLATARNPHFAGTCEQAPGRPADTAGRMVL